MTTIEDFIHERLVEDERIACTAAESFANEGRKAEWHEQWSGSLNVGDELHTLGDSTVTRHAERHDPARVLRQCAALRAIVSEHDLGTDPCDSHGAAFESVTCGTVQAIAAIWSTHRDYDPSWAVDGGGSTP